MTGIRYDEIRPGCYDGAARAADMVADGIDAAMVSGPQTTMQHFLASPDDEFLLAGFEACNNFLIDEFCAADPARLIPLPQVSSLSIGHSTAALERLSARGATAVLLSGWPAGERHVTATDDRFWAAASDHDVTVCIHVQLHSAAARRSEQGLSYTGPNAVRMEPELQRAMSIANLATVFGNAMSHMSQLLLSGVFERYPALRVVMLEIGAGWIPHYLQQLDDRFWRLRAWASPPISQPPSFYWARNMAANIIWDPAAVTLRHEIGIDNIIWSSDYPHHVCDWPLSRRTIAQQLGHIDRSERAAIVGGNARRIYRLG
jgi:predicted TIM-barrel fold metal-dependent hydrolase